MSNKAPMQNSLSRLIDLRERELEQHQAKLAAKQQLRDRQAAMVTRLEQLSQQIGPTGAAVPSLAANSAAYKQAVLQWAEQQRQAMLAVARKQEAYGQLLGRVVSRAQQAEERQQQKFQDDLASQVWQRGLA